MVDPAVLASARVYEDIDHPLAGSPAHPEFRGAHREVVPRAIALVQTMVRQGGVLVVGGSSSQQRDLVVYKIVLEAYPKVSALRDSLKADRLAPQERESWYSWVCRKLDSHGVAHSLVLGDRVIELKPPANRRGVVSVPDVPGFADAVLESYLQASREYAERVRGRAMGASR